MFRLAVLLGLIGLAAATGIIVWSGAPQVLQALDVAGWGILWTSLYHLVPQVASNIGWRALMPGHKRPSLLYFFYLQWLRSSINNLLPVARIGGEIVAVRFMVKHGIRKSLAIASTVVELTTSVLSVFVFDLSGIVLFTLRVADTGVQWKLIMGVLMSVPMLGGLVAVQRIGFFGLLDKIFTFMIRDKWKKFAGNTAQLDRAVRMIYRRRGRVLFCSLWQLAGWFLCVGETWLGLYFLGHNFGLLKCFMIEALIQAASSAAFVVPGAVGVQEAGFLLFGHMLGLAPDVAVALAVIRRCRDVILYVPGLIVWQAQEGHWLLRKT